VSLNAIIGDNGIITKAQSANVKTGMAALEEWLQEQYVELYDIDKNMSGVSALDVLKNNYPEYFYNPRENTGLSYILRDGYMYYLIQKSSLPEEIRSSLNGGDAGDGSYSAYSTFQDVYGVTSNLKVYYCSDGLESLIGTSEKMKDDPTRISISASSSAGFASYLKDTYDWIKTDENGNVLAEGLEAIKTLSLENVNLTSLSDLYNFSSLKKLYVSNSSITSLKGLENATILTNFYITNSVIEDYSKLGGLNNLNVLYLENVTTDEVEKLGTALKNSNMNNLEYFGIINSPNVTSTNAINNFSSVTKASIKYMYLYGNSEVDVVIGDGFDSVYELYITQNNSLDGSYYNNETIKTITLGKMPVLAYLYARNIRYLENFSLASASNLYYIDMYYNKSCKKINFPNTVDNGLNSLNSLNLRGESALVELKLYASNLTYINMQDCYKLEDFSFLENCNNITSYILHGCSKLENLDFIKNNKVVTTINCNSCSSLTDISGIKNNTTLTIIHLNATKIGKDKDVSYDTSTEEYTLLEKSSQNEFYGIFENKPELYYITAQNCYYLGYISYLATNAKLTNVYFRGDINISAAEVSLLVNNSSSLVSKNCTWPRVTDGEWQTSSLTQSTTTFFAGSIILQSDFENLVNYPKIRYFSVRKIYKDDGITELTDEEYNTCINNTLSQLSNLYDVSIAAPIYEITFVKNNPNLVRLYLSDSANVGTHRSNNGTKEEYDNGLKLLNTNCSNFSLLAYTSTNINIDLSLLQPMLNKISKNMYNSSDKSLGGFSISSTDVLSTLSKCTDLEYFYYKDFPAGSNIDLSKCSNLKWLYISSTSASNALQYISLPQTLPTSTGTDGTTYSGYEATIIGLSVNGTLSLSPACNKLTIENLYDVDSEEKLWAYISGINNYQKITISYLKELTIDMSGTNYTSYICGDDASKTYSLSILNRCSKLEKIYYYGANSATSKLSSISTLTNCTSLKEIYFDQTIIGSLPDLSNLSLLEKLTITNSSLVDISGLLNNNSNVLSYINFNNNSIYDLRAIANLKALKTLNVENNSIRNVFESADGQVNNVLILNTLKESYEQKFTELYIKNNYIADTSASELSWAKSI
jgi:hypothetical protein